jgi:hypothetical protein
VATAKKKDWINDAVNKPGALRKETHTPAGKNIPVSKLNQLAKESGKTGQRARLALTLRKINKK